MTLIKTEIKGKVAVISLSGSTTNPINWKMVSQLSREIQEAKCDSSVRGILLTSSSKKFFSIGLDLPELMPLSPREFHNFLGSFNDLCITLYGFPGPTAAAIPGHAIAGGCILALCCDYRYIAKGKNLMGLNEVKLGVPVPYPADRILNQIVGSMNSRLIMESGKFFSGESLSDLSIVDGIVEPEILVKETIKNLRELISLPDKGYDMIKMNRTGPILEDIRKKREEKEKSFVDLWYSSETRKLLNDAVKKF